MDWCKRPLEKMGRPWAPDGRLLHHEDPQEVRKDSPDRCLR